MIYLIWLLRIVHILGGIFWVGGALIMAFFVAPAVGATAEAGQKVVGHLMGNLKFSSRISAAAGFAASIQPPVLSSRLRAALNRRSTSTSEEAAI